mgnify:CR=1 FL=1
MRRCWSTRGLSRPAILRAETTVLTSRPMAATPARRRLPRSDLCRLPPRAERRQALPRRRFRLTHRRCTPAWRLRRRRCSGPRCATRLSRSGQCSRGELCGLHHSASGGSTGTAHAGCPGRLAACPRSRAIRDGGVLDGRAVASTWAASTSASPIWPRFSAQKRSRGRERHGHRGRSATASLRVGTLRVRGTRTGCSDSAATKASGARAGRTTIIRSAAAPAVARSTRLAAHSAGRGYGHGVGMSADGGCQGMGEQGVRTAEKILEEYYSSGDDARLHSARADGRWGGVSERLLHVAGLEKVDMRVSVRRHRRPEYPRGAPPRGTGSGSAAGPLGVKRSRTLHRSRRTIVRADVIWPPGGRHGRQLCAEADRPGASHERPACWAPRRRRRRRHPVFTRTRRSRWTERSGLSFAPRGGGA